MTRRDLHPGYQAVQSCHAAIQFCFEHFEHQVTKEWYEKSNYLGLLVAKNELELNELAAKAQSQGIVVSVFREPDIGDEVTAIALEPGPRTKRLCSALPLAFSS